MGELDMSGDLGWEDQIAKRDFSDASSSEEVEIKAKKSTKKHVKQKPPKKKGKRQLLIYLIFILNWRIKEVTILF